MKSVGVCEKKIRKLVYIYRLLIAIDAKNKIMIIISYLLETTFCQYVCNPYNE